MNVVSVEKFQATNLLHDGSYLEYMNAYEYESELEELNYGNVQYTVMEGNGMLSFT